MHLYATASETSFWSGVPSGCPARKTSEPRRPVFEALARQVLNLVAHSPVFILTPSKHRHVTRVLVFERNVYTSWVSPKVSVGWPHITGIMCAQESDTSRDTRMCKRRLEDEKSRGQIDAAAGQLRKSGE